MSLRYAPGEHWHCPLDCEKPQPYEDGGRRWCGRCFHEGRGQIEVFLCTPRTCPGDVLR